MEAESSVGAVVDALECTDRGGCLEPGPKAETSGSNRREQRESFRQFCTLVSSVFHFEYLKQLEELKDAYAAFDPDADTKPLHPPSAEQREKD